MINYNSFYIGDTRGFSPYIRNGIARNIKMPVKIDFLPLEKCLKSGKVPFDSDM